MTEPSTKLPVTGPEKEFVGRHPFQALRREVDRLFEDFDTGFWRHPFRHLSALDIEPFVRPEISWGRAPAVDVAETDKGFEVSAELPGIDASAIEVKLVNGDLTIKGEKKEEKEEKMKDFYRSERHYGVFERSFHLPEGVDADKITARFKNGVLTVTLPKTAEAQKAEKKITVQAA